MPKPAAGGLDTPKVRPADGLRPGLLKLNPELLVVPKPRETKNKQTGKDEKRLIKMTNDYQRFYPVDSLVYPA